MAWLRMARRWKERQNVAPQQWKDEGRSQCRTPPPSRAVSVETTYRRRVTRTAAWQQAVRRADKKAREQNQTAKARALLSEIALIQLGLHH
eukprot:6004895-Alexandrium_andersonii.AAC.1